MNIVNKAQYENLLFKKVLFTVESGSFLTRSEPQTDRHKISTFLILDIHLVLKNKGSLSLIIEVQFFKPQGRVGYYLTRWKTKATKVHFILFP